MRIMSLGGRPIADKLSTRRACLRFSAALVTLGGLTVPRAGGRAQVAPPLLETLAAGLPRLDGEMRFDEAARRAAAAPDQSKLLRSKVEAAFLSGHADGPRSFASIARAVAGVR